MRKEYDFSKGTRGKHTGKQIRVVGASRERKGSDTAARIQRTIERDLKSREDFKVVWNELGQAEKESIRTVWLKKIRIVLAEQSERTSRRV